MLASIWLAEYMQSPVDIEGRLFNNLKEITEAEYKEQIKPRGLPDAFILGEKFINKSNVAMILGDNFFYGQNLSKLLINCAKIKKGAKIILHNVQNPELFGVAKLNPKSKKIIKIVEKPKKFISNNAITGLYFFDNKVVEYSKKLKPSKRGELEITDLLRKTQPIVRYELNDIISEKKNCPCGSKHIGINQIEGRSDDIITIRNATGAYISIFPDIIRRTIVLADPDISDYKVIFNRSTFHLAIKSQNKTSFSKAKNALIHKLNTYDIYDFNIVKKVYEATDLGIKKRRVENLND